MSLINTEVLQRVQEVIKKKAPNYQYEISYKSASTSLLRFAQTKIHQNNHSEVESVSITLALDKKVSKTTFNEFSVDSIDRTIDELIEVSNKLPSNPEFIGFPGKIEKTGSSIENTRSFDQFCNDASSCIKTIFDLATKNKIEAYGSISQTTRKVIILNSNGLKNEGEVSFLNCQSQMMNGRASGYAQTTGKTFYELEIDRIANESAKTCINGKYPKTIEIGDYPVLLKSEAVADLIRMMNHIAIGTKTIEEGRSYLSGKLNKKVIDEKISITDDPTNKYQISMGMDFQGYPHKKPIHLVKNGVFSEMVYGHKYSIKNNTINTGNAAFSSESGPFPSCLVVSSMDTEPFSELLSKMKNGILITRFWYANPVSPMDAEVTGLTRDGTFIVNNGVASPIKNLRYTDNIFKVLSNVIAVGDDSRLSGMVVTPSILCGNMRFTGILPE